MADVTTDHVSVTIKRFHLLGRHVCTPDLRKVDGCPMLSILRCNALESEKIETGAEIPGFPPYAILPHPSCPISVKEIPA